MESSDSHKSGDPASGLSAMFINDSQGGLCPHGAPLWAALGDGLGPVSLAHHLPVPHVAGGARESQAQAGPRA